MNLTLQYSIVGVIVIAAIIWIVASIVKMREKKNSGCYGCSMHDICSKKQITEHSAGCDKDYSRDL